MMPKLYHLLHERYVAKANLWFNRFRSAPLEGSKRRLPIATGGLMQEQRSSAEVNGRGKAVRKQLSEVRAKEFMRENQDRF